MTTKNTVEALVELLLNEPARLTAEEARVARSTLLYERNKWRSSTDTNRNRLVEHSA